MKRYKLKKDLPTFKAGDRFHINADDDLVLDNSWIVAYSKSTLEKFPNILTDWFEEIEDEYNRWRAKNGVDYWWINDGSGVWSNCVEDDNTDDGRYNVGNYFKTEAEAEAYRKYLLARQVLLDDAEGGKWIESKDDWYVFYNSTGWNTANAMHYRPGIIYFHDVDALEKSLEEHKDQWEIVRKYEMGEM